MKLEVHVTGLDEVQNIITKLVSWSDAGAKQDVDAGARIVDKEIIQDLYAGHNLAPLRPSTLDGPLRRETDNRNRSEFGDTPLVATGQTAASISLKRNSPTEWEISSNTDRGDMILASNAKTSHRGSPFAGDPSRPVRDPLVVDDKKADIMEDTLVRGIERVLNG